jgi:hypothetical protein
MTDFTQFLAEAFKFFLTAFLVLTGISVITGIGRSVARWITGDDLEEEE